jgi:hypothetical protein
MLRYLDAEARGKHWFRDFQILDLDQQDSLAGLVFRIALRRLVKQNDYNRVASLLIDADQLGLSACPMASQAAELLQRMELLSHSLTAQAMRAQGAAA